MTEGVISRRIVADRIAWIHEMLAEIRTLPLGSRALFFADRRNVWTAESCLRRALEALLDLGRHILAKGFAVGTSEYKEIARRLVEKGVLEESVGRTLQTLAGYRNRLVHFYHEVSREELYHICRDQLEDVHIVLEHIKAWLLRNPQRMDNAL